MRSEPLEFRSMELKKIFVFFVGLLSLVYIFNPGAGFFELIPDNIPLIGNLDEAAAVALLLMCLRYFGIELPDIFRKKENRDKTLENK